MYRLQFLASNDIFSLKQSKTFLRKGDSNKMPNKKRFEEHRKALEEKRATVSHLITEADSKEDMLKENMKQSSNFLDGKYTTVTKYSPISQEPPPAAVPPSAAIPPPAAPPTPKPQTAPTRKAAVSPSPKPATAPSTKLTAPGGARKTSKDTDFSFSAVFETKDETKDKAKLGAKTAKPSPAKPGPSNKPEPASESTSMFSKMSSMFSSNPSSITTATTTANTTAAQTPQGSTLTVPGSAKPAKSADSNISSGSPSSNINVKGIMKPGPSRISQIFRDEDMKGMDKKAAIMKKSTTSIQSESGFHHAVEALLSLQGASVIFMQRLLDYEEIQAAGIRFHEDTVDLAYQILNVQGTLLFLMEQHKIKCSAFIVYTKRSFENILYDVQGNVVLKFLGPSVIMSRMVSRMTITDAEDRLLGYMKEFGKRVNYSVYNAKGERLFLIISNSYLPSSNTPFSILCRGQKIGVIKFGWKHVYHDLPYIDYETTGVEFPADMDEREKALLIGCMTLIEFSWYSPLTKLRLSMLFVGVILFSLGILITFFPFFVESTTRDSETASFYKVKQRR